MPQKHAYNGILDVLDMYISLNLSKNRITLAMARAEVSDEVEARALAEETS